MGVGCHSCTEICSSQDAKYQTEPDTDLLTRQFIHEGGTGSPEPSDGEIPEEEEEESPSPDGGAILHSSVIEHSYLSVQQRKNLINDFQQAIKGHNLSLASVLVDEYPTIDFVSSQYPNGNTCLEEAVGDKNHKAVEYLLQNEASPNIQNEHGDTSLHTAARAGDLKSCQLLHKYGGNPRIANQDDETAITIADELYHDAIVHEFGAVPEDLDGKVLRLLKKKTRPRQSTKLRDKYITSARDVLLLSPTMNEPNNTSVHEQQQSAELIQISDEIFLDMQDTLTKDKKKLRPMDGWLDKKQSSPPYSYDRRWVCIRDGHLLWCDRQIHVGVKGLDKYEKRRWNRCINILDIEYVKAITEGKTQRKFKIKANDKDKSYIFRAETTAARNKWVKRIDKGIQVWQQDSLF